MTDREVAALAGYSVVFVKGESLALALAERNRLRALAGPSEPGVRGILVYSTLDSRPVELVGTSRTGFDLYVTTKIVLDTRRR